MSYFGICVCMGVFFFFLCVCVCFCVWFFVCFTSTVFWCIFFMLISHRVTSYLINWLPGFTGNSYCWFYNIYDYSSPKIHIYRSAIKNESPFLLCVVNVLIFISSSQYNMTNFFSVRDHCTCSFKGQIKIQSMVCKLDGVFHTYLLLTLSFILELSLLYFIGLSRLL